MTTWLIAAGAVIAVGSFLRWGTWPVMLAYELGKIIERAWPRSRP